MVNTVQGWRKGEAGQMSLCANKYANVHTDVHVGRQRLMLDFFSFHISHILKYFDMYAFVFVFVVWGNMFAIACV